MRTIGDAQPPLSRAGRIALAALVLGAVAVRVAYVWWARQNGAAWIDPDHYLEQGQRFADGQALEAFRYSGDFFKAPLHTVVLGICALVPGSYPHNAMYVQAVAGGLATAAFFALTRRLSTVPIALGAAAAYAIFFPSITALVAVRQEHVYIPLLVVAFAALARGADAGGRPATMAVAGAALGLAALARSMPVYFVPAAAVLVSTWPAGRRAGAALLGGFLLVTMPFTIWISREAGQLMLIENIGSYGLGWLMPEGREHFGGAAPSLLSMAGFLWQQFAEAPVAYVRELISIVIGMFHVPGGDWLVEMRFLSAKSSATLAKVFAHLTGDLVLVLSICLAPFGVVLRTGTRMTWLLGLWVLVHLFFTALSGYGGQRFRVPADFALLALASAALAGGWRQLSTVRALIAASALLPMAIGAASSISDSLRARAPYGVVEWSEDYRQPPVRVRARSGFHVHAAGGRIALLVSEWGTGAPDGGPWMVDALVDGLPIARLSIGSVPSPLHVLYEDRVAFVEFDVVAAGAPTRPEPHLWLSSVR